MCFQCGVWNGTYIRNNFIDYYRVIFDPGENGGWGNVNSIGNNYQVFLYFYKNFNKEVTSAPLSLNSIGDIFNWTKNNEGNSAPEIDRFTKDTYVGLDGNTYNVPTYILCITQKAYVVIRDCVLENNLGNIVFVDSPINNKSKIVFSCNESGEYLLANNNVIPVGRKQGTTDDKAYKLMSNENTELYLDKHCIETVDSLVVPQFKSSPTAGTYSKYVTGEKVYYNSRVYTLRVLHRDSLEKFEWVPDNELSTSLTYSRIVYNTVTDAATLNIQYTMCYVKSIDANQTISTLNVPEGLRYIPITIFNYEGSGNTITISALQYGGESVVLKPAQCCTFIACNSYQFRVLSVSDASRKRGTTAQRPTLTQAEAGYEYYDTTLNRPIWYTGGMWTGADGGPLSNNVATYGVIAERPPLDSINAGFMYTCIHTFQIDGTTYPTGTYIYDTPLAEDGMWITPDGATLYDSQMPERELHVIATYNSTDFQLEALNETSGLWSTTQAPQYYSAFVDLSGFGRGAIKLTYSGKALLMDHFPEVGEDFNSSYISMYTNTDEEEITLPSGVKYLVLISQGGNGGGTVEIMSARNKSQLASYNASDMSRSFNNPNGQYLVVNGTPGAWLYRQNNDNYATGYLDVSSYVGKMANITYTSSQTGICDVVFMADYPTNNEPYVGSYISKISVPNGYDIQIPANAKYVFFVHLDRHASYGTANITIYELV